MLKVKAHAKINWTLDITGRRDDGYHLMDMLMQTISVYDTISLDKADTIILEGQSNVKSDSENGASLSSEAVKYDESNIVWKAAQALRKAANCNFGAYIELRKQIPSGAGLGGGSADAAAVLMGLNRLWQLDFSLQKLEEIGLSLGADVPFMLNGGFARVRGIGEQICKLSLTPKYSLVLCKACDGLSTGAVFNAYDNSIGIHEYKHPDQDAAIEAILKGDMHALKRHAGNVLEQVSAQYRPQIPEAIQVLYEQDALFSSMTGSGSVVFGIFEDMYSAAYASKKLHEYYADKNVWISWANTMNHPCFL